MDVHAKTNQTTVSRTLFIFFSLGSAQPPVEDSACHFASARPLIRGREVCYSRCRRAQGKMSGIPCGSTEILRDYSCDGCIMPCSAALGPCKDFPSLLCLWILNQHQLLANVCRRWAHHRCLYPHFSNTESMQMTFVFCCPKSHRKATQTQATAGYEQVLDFNESVICFKSLLKTVLLKSLSRFN